MKPNKKQNGTATDRSVGTPSAASVWIVNAGLLMVAFATLLPIIHFGLEWYRWVYGAGALLAIAGRIMSIGIYRNAPLRVKRLSRMELWATVMFAVATFFMFYPGAGSTDWLAFTLAGAALQAYSSLMIPRAIAKANEENGPRV